MSFTISAGSMLSAADASYFASEATVANTRLQPRPRGRFRERVMERWGPIKARYDAAQTTDENAKHWIAADDLSARAANSHAVRAILRRRARYERDNNSWLKGMVKTFANEVIGTGPRLQVQTSNEAFNRVIEQRWREWAVAVDLAAKLRLVAETRLVDGEIFGLLAYNPENAVEVKLDIKLVEADQVMTPFPKWGDITAVDGIRFDKYGNPREYDFLPYHPGGSGEFAAAVWNFTPDVIAARNVLHWFRLERAGQARGIPDVTPMIPLLSQLRRYTLAVLQAAELAACITAVIKTNYPLEAGEAPQVDAFEVADIVRGMFQMLPNGADMEAFKSEQPVTGYGEFVDRLLKESARSLEMPYGTATGDSSQYNYSGGRLDVQSWVRKVGIERSWHARPLDRIFLAWVEEGSKIPGYLPTADLGPPQRWTRMYHWDGFQHVDPSKEAAANDTSLRNMSTNLTELAAAEGKDFIDKLNTIAREVEACKARGLVHPCQIPDAKDAPPTIDDGDERSGKTTDQEKADARELAAV